MMCGRNSVIVGQRRTLVSLSHNNLLVPGFLSPQGYLAEDLSVKPRFEGMATVRNCAER